MDENHVASIAVASGVAVTLFTLCVCLACLSYRRRIRRAQPTPAAFVPHSSNHPDHLNNPHYPPPPWNPHSSVPPPFPPPLASQPPVHPSQYHAMHPSSNWAAYNQQRLPHVTVAHPQRAPHHIHYNPMYVSAAPHPPHPPHPPAAPPVMHDPRIDVEDLLSFDAPEKEKNNPCPICLAPLEDEQVSTGQCLHLIHTSCLRSWLAKDARSTCPVCLIPYQDAAFNDSDPQTTAPQSATQLTSVVPHI